MFKTREIKDAINKGGFLLLVKRMIRYSLVQVLPRENVNYNGIEVREGRKLGFLVPSREYSDKSSYEKGLINSLEENLSLGDDVVVVGGGKGVTSVKAKQLVGEDGKVTVYEPAIEMLDVIKQTAEINDVEIDDLNHAAIGDINSPRGNALEAVELHPSRIPDCDVLEIDCEGAELEILENIEIEPEYIIVESHGVYGSPSKEVKEILTDNGYKIINSELAEDNPKLEDEDVKVITAINRD